MSLRQQLQGIKVRPCSQVHSNLQEQLNHGAAEVQQLQADLAAAVEAEAEKDKEVQALGIFLHTLPGQGYCICLALVCSTCGLACVLEAGQANPASVCW